MTRETAGEADPSFEVPATSQRGVVGRSIVDVLHDAASAHGRRPFLNAPDGTRTFSGLAREVASVARELRVAGVEAGEPVVLLAPAGIAFVAHWLGLIARGAIPVPLYEGTAPRELEYAMDDAGARKVVFAEPHRALVERGAGDAEAIALVAGERSIGISEAAITPSSGFDCAALVYTSGTSGPPKGVMLSHATYLWAGEGYPRWVGLGAGDHLWTTLPLHHINAQAYAFMAALTTGLPLTISSGFRASTFWRDAAEIGATVTNLVGGMLHRIAGSGQGAYRPNGLRLVYASPAGQPDFRAQFESAYGIRLRTGYGLTESVFGCIEAPDDEPRVDGIGRVRHHPAFQNELKIVDSAGVEVSPGTEGEIMLRNPARMLGYWRAPELTAKRLRDGWVHTGDLGSRDPDGYVYLRGRLKEMLRRKGENISPWEVEQVLLEMDGVTEAAVIGTPNSDGEEDLHAFVVLTPGLQAEANALRTWCQANLADFKVPDRFHSVARLPKTSTDRVRKKVLLDEAGLT